MIYFEKVILSLVEGTSTLLGKVRDWTIFSIDGIFGQTTV